MNEVLISKKRVFIGVILLGLWVGGGIWGFPYIQHFLPGQTNADGSPVPVKTATPGEDQLAQAAARIGAQAFYTVDFQKGQKVWEDGLCGVSTKLGCLMDQNVIAPNLWDGFEKAKTVTTVLVTAQEKVQEQVASTRSNAPIQIWRLQIQLSAPWPMQQKPQTTFPALAMVVNENGAWKFERFLTEDELAIFPQKDGQK